MLIRPMAPEDVPAADAAAWAGLRTQIPVEFLAEAEAAGDQALCDAVSCRVRGAAHGPDVGALEQAGARLLVHDEGGWAAVRDGSPVLVAAGDEAIARDLLWSALAAATPGATIHLAFLTAGQDWAVEVCLQARLALSSDGPLFVRGDVGQMRPYIPSGAYL